MKKTLFFTYLFLTFGVNISGQKTEIRYQYTDSYDFTKADWKTEPYFEKQINIFDSKNRLVETNERVVGGLEIEISYTKLKYDARGNLIEKRYRSKSLFKYENVVQWQYTDFDSLAFYRESYVDDSLKQEVVLKGEKRTYDSKNRLLEVTSPFLEKNNQTVSPLFASRKYSYFDDNKISAIEEKNPLYRNLNQLSTYFYDDKKRLVRTENYNISEPNFINKVEYVYNDKNQIIKVISLSGDKNLNNWKENQRIEYGYDTMNNQSSTVSIFYNPDGSVSYYTKKTDEFDEKRKILKSINYSFDKIKGEFREILQLNYTYNNLELLEKVVSRRPIDNSNKEYVSASSVKYDDKKRQKEVIIEDNGFLNGQTPYNYKNRYRYIYEDLEQPPTDLLENYVIYPNPAIDEINIINTLKDNCLVEVTLNSLNGQLLARFIPADITDTFIERYKNLCDWYIKIPISLQNGQYLIIMKNGDGQSIGKRIYINR